MFSAREKRIPYKCLDIQRRSHPSARHHLTSNKIENRKHLQQKQSICDVVQQQDQSKVNRQLLSFVGQGASGNRIPKLFVGCKILG